MAPAADDIELDEAPTTIDPYAILKVSKTATQPDIKSAYRKLALQVHPDKAPADERETAHKAFQELAFAYAILSDERRRSRYDATGRTEESLHDGDEEGDFDWTSFYRAQYADVVTSSAIAEFAKEYKGSEEEREAVLEAYVKHNGDMNGVYDLVMTSNPLEDEERFQTLIKEAIESGYVKAFKRFTEESEESRAERMEEASEEANEAEEHAKFLGVHEELFGHGDGKAVKGKKKVKDGKKGAEDVGDGALAALIQQRQKTRGQDFLADLEAKYAPKPKNGGKKAATRNDEPPEEAFARNAKRAKSGNEDADNGSKRSKRSKT